MIFNASATHALRALAALAANEREDATLGHDLAEELGIPAHYLAKVLATLARAGLLNASRGVRGGYRLARRAEEITLLEIVEPFEGRRVRPGCLLRPDQPCREDGTCPAHDAWSGVKAAYARFLETTMLADIRGGAVQGAPPGIRRAGQRAARTRGGGSKARRTRA
jgi:Rrf2 family protein